MLYTTEEYFGLKSDNVPYTTKFGFTLEEIGGDCPICESELTGMKITANEYEGFCVFRSVGICENCKVVITCSPFKVTENGKCFELLEKEWCLLKENLLRRVVQWFFTVFSRLFYK